MGVGRVLSWILGCVLVLGAVAMLYLETGLATWVPYSVAGLGIVVLLGLMIMGAATSMEPGRGTVVVDREVPVVRRESRDERYVESQRPAQPATFTEPAPPMPARSFAPAAGDVQYTGVAHSARIEPDGTRVEGTVRTERVVRNTATGPRTFTRKTKTVTRRPPARTGKARKTRTHRAGTTVTRRTR